MKVGITGTRWGTTYQRRKTLDRLLEGVTELHHGNCVGADEEAHTIAESRGIHVVMHPVRSDGLFVAHKMADEVREAKGHLARNRDIVAECDKVIALPQHNREQYRSGTWYTIRHALRTMKPVTVVLPSGNTVEGEKVLGLLREGRWGE